jgi:uncharacterized protein YutE (UPF0331/DUF86 family)
MFSSDQKRFSKILNDIERYLTDAQSIGYKSIRNDRDRRNYYAIVMVLFVLINRIIDLGREVLYARGYALPDEELKNKVVFKKLYDHGKNDWQMREDLVCLVNFRNKCSHHFHEIDPDEVKEIFLHLSLMEDFTLKMKNDLKVLQHRRVGSVAIAACALLLILLLLVFFV